MLTGVQRLYNNLNESQAKTLQQFRNTVHDILRPEHDDFYLLRWLVARNFNIKKAEKMLRNHMQWRERMGADTILEDYQPPEVLKKYYSGGLIGRDKDGDLVWIDPFGNVDLKGLLSSASRRDMVKYQMWRVEGIYKKFAELSAKENRKINSTFNIFDMQNFGLRHLWGPGVDVFNEVIAMFEDQYPETLKVTLVVNAPYIFPIAYKLVSPFLSEETKAKTKILGKNYKKELLQYIDADQLPVHYGGTKTDTDGDPKCSSQICYAGPVPKSYHIQESPAFLEDSTEVTVSRGSSVQLKYTITSPHSILRWHFTTVHSDIGFSIHRQDNTNSHKVELSDNEQVLANQRVNSHMVPEDGSIKCKQPGTYVITFDNTYSWIHSKKVHYKVDVLDSAASDIITQQLDK